jgi:putative ABC transport system permease protein
MTPDPAPIPPPVRGFLAHFLSAWTWRMAWRDSRASRRKLFLFSCSIVLGIAALAALGSLGSNLERAIEDQTRELLGADLVLHSREAFTPDVEQWMRDLGGEQSRLVSLNSMILLPRTGGTRLAQVRALQGNFPFFGRLETDPPDAASLFRTRGGVLVEDNLMRQYGAEVGDAIRIGKLETRIAGRLLKVPGESFALATIAPRVYLRMADLPQTDLVREASLVNFSASFRFAENTNVPARVATLLPQFEKLHLRPETAEDRRRELGRAMDNLFHFLNLAGFIALLLGGVGVASAVHAHVRQKLGSVAVLRCLGGSVSQTFAIYVAQGLALGAAGALMGGLLGVLLQLALPRVLGDFIPFSFPFHVAWLAIGRAMSLGLVICMLFTLLPLLTVRRVSPLAAIRIAFEPPGRDPWRWVVGGCIAGGILAFALMQSRDWRVGLSFAGGLGVVFAVLAVIARMLIWLSRRLVPAALPFTVRQGVANLHRPNNRTLLLLLALGLGTFLLATLYLVEGTLYREIALSSGGNQPNAVLFDVQNSQRDAVAALLRSLRLPVMQDTPVVAMRLASVKGRTVDSILANRGRGRGGWAYRREYRSTYTDQLREGEKIIAGKWIPEVRPDTQAVPVSVEQSIAKELQVGLGDELAFDVAGTPVVTRVASLREVEWRRLEPNFFVVFPRGVLESAPAMHVIVTHVHSSGESADMQRRVVEAFPNVSAIDLTLVLETVDTLLHKITFAIQFLTLFTVLTGLIVLVASLVTSRYERIREVVLLRALGASRGQVFRIQMVEYFSLGALAALTGMSLALAAAWSLAKFLFDAPFNVDIPVLCATLLAVPAITMITGFLMSRGVLRHPPLAVLRSEE